MELLENPLAQAFIQWFITIGLLGGLSIPLIRIVNDKSSSIAPISLMIAIVTGLAVLLTYTDEILKVLSIAGEFEFLEGLGVEIGGGIVTAFMVAYFVKFFERFETRPQSQSTSIDAKSEE